jgi:N-carbamoyl-L-amino-acid hydrolase
VGAFFEVHIEQGPILEKAALPVGVVLGAQGQRLFQVTVDGDEGHAGTLPMDQRRDALLGAARMIDAVNGVAFRYDPLPVITVGNIRVRPNSRNTISGQTVFSIDSRYPDDDALAEIAAALRDACETIALEAGHGLEFREISARGTVAFDEDIIETIRGAAARLGIFNQEIFSGAGHDACNMASVAPSGMIFVPCEDGISHNERENARPQDLAAGCNVLLHAMLDRAGTV